MSRESDVNHPDNRHFMEDAHKDWSNSGPENIDFGFYSDNIVHVFRLLENIRRLEKTLGIDRENTAYSNDSYRKDIGSND